MKIKLAFLAFTAVYIYSCSKDTSTETDQAIFNQAKSASGFVWYKNSDVKLAKSTNSGHSPAFMRTRYNAIAAKQLDANGKVKPDALFENGSLIVKEFYSSASSTEIDFYAIMYHNDQDPLLPEHGWLWAYYNTDGSARYSVTNKGGNCHSCHSQQGIVDHTLMNKYFP